MEKGTHGKSEKKFADLTHASQARSINAQILGLGRALNAHFTRAKLEGKTYTESKQKYKLQLERLIQELNKGS